MIPIRGARATIARIAGLKAGINTLQRSLSRCRLSTPSPPIGERSSKGQLGVSISLKFLNPAILVSGKHNDEESGDWTKEKRDEPPEKTTSPLALCQTSVDQ